MRDYGIVLRAGDVNMPTVMLALATVAAACNRSTTNNYGCNKWLLSRIRASKFLSKHRLHACSIQPQYLDNSCRIYMLTASQSTSLFCARLNLSTNGGALADPEYVRMVAPQFEPRQTDRQTDREKAFI